MVTLLIFLSQLGLTNRGRLWLAGQGGGTQGLIFPSMRCIWNLMGQWNWKGLREGSRLCIRSESVLEEKEEVSGAGGGWGPQGWHPGYPGCGTRWAGWPGGEAGFPWGAARGVAQRPGEQAGLTGGALAGWEPAGLGPGCPALGFHTFQCFHHLRVTCPQLSDVSTSKWLGNKKQ